MKEARKKVLIVDDDTDYAYLLEQALMSIEPRVSVEVIHSGTELLIWLEMNMRPDLIFLDIKMPILDGFEVLQVLKTDERHKTVPIVMFSESIYRDDIIKSYEIGANAYMVKPMSFNHLVPQIEALCQFWFNDATILQSRNTNNY